MFEDLPTASGEDDDGYQRIILNGRQFDIYRNIVAIGNDVDVRGGIRCGSVLVGEMTVAGE